MTWLSNDVVEHLRAAAVAPALPGDRYEVVRTIGRGGMGTVYAARDRQLDREVAIKVSNAPAPGAALEERLAREARVLARLDHPGVVPVYDAGALDDGRLYYVMKLVLGETLAERADRLAEPAGALPVFERVVETVAFAHAKGVGHRDLNPSNIMVGSFGQVFVLDWGVAKIFGLTPDADNMDAMPSHTDSGHTMAGTRIGTTGFMAPELDWGGAADADARADVYSLGALLFWLLAGQPPGSDEAGASRLLQGVSPALPKRLRAIVLKCLAVDSRGRYADAGGLSADLARYRAGQPVLAYRETFFDRIGRWFGTYRAFILLVLAYVVMRALLALWKGV